jgi:hypothetical protein
MNHSSDLEECFKSACEKLSPELKEAYRKTYGPRRKMITAIKDAIFCSNDVVATLYKYSSPETLLTKEGPRVFECIHHQVSQPGFGHLFAHLQAPRLAGQVAGLAYRVVARGTGLSELLRTLEDPPDESVRRVDDDLIPGLVVACLATAASFHFIWEHEIVSDDFQTIASKFSGLAWADRLLARPCSSNWKVEEAWTKADLSPQQKSEAVRTLCTVPGFMEVDFLPGQKFDSRNMKCLDESPMELVHEVKSPGLKRGGALIEKARVLTCTPDYLTIQSLMKRDNDLTRIYLKRLGTPCDRNHVLVPTILQDMADSASDDGYLDDWLHLIVINAPDLDFVVSKPGVPYVEREMMCVSSLRVKAAAKVTSVHYRGLKRKLTGEILLPAKVEANDDNIDPFT